MKEMELKMRKLLLTTAAITALSAPAFAADLGGAPDSGSPLYSSAPMVSGDISGALGGAWYSSGGDSDSTGVYDASARFALPLVSGISFEGELLDSGAFQDDYSTNSFMGLAHLYAQTPNYALGVFGGAGSSTPASLWQLGVEGQAYLGNLTAEGSVTYTGLSVYSIDANLWNARLGGRYYFTPDTKLALGVNYFSIEGMGESGDAWGVDGSLEHRMTGTPWSGFVKASYLDGEGASQTTALVGVRVSLDAAGSTLQSHDRAVPWQSSLGLVGIGF
jgi:hypothetical protein